MIPRASVVGLLLAGGQSRRLGGGDKCLIEVSGRSLLAHCIERARGQVGALVLNANGDAARFAAYGLPVAADVVGGYAGPLAGILTGLEWARERAASARWVASIAADTPLFPLDLVARLAAAVEMEGAEIGCAASGGRTHPVFGLWPVRLAAELREALTGEGIRKIDAWTARYKVATAEWPAGDDDPFFNVNTPEELQELARRLNAAPQPSTSAKGR